MKAALPGRSPAIKFSSFFEKFKPVDDLLGLIYKNKYPNIRFSVSGDGTDFNGNVRNGFVESIDRDGLPDPIITLKGAAGRFSALPAATTIPQTSENANNFRFSVSGNGTDFNGNERTGTELNGQKLDEDYFAALERGDLQAAEAMVNNLYRICWRQQSKKKTPER